MPTGIEIAGLVIASTGMGQSVASKIVKYTGKGAAQKAYDDAMNQFTQVKAFRSDENINQFLNETDQKKLDESIQNITFDLMDLQSMLQELNGVAYYHIKAYRVNWRRFHDHFELTLKLIVRVNVEIKERSAHGRIQAGLGNKREAPFSGNEALGCGDEAIAISQGSGSGSALNQQIAEDMASVVTAAMRSSMTDGTTSHPLTLSPGQNCMAHIPSGSQSTRTDGIKQVSKWPIAPKARSAPPSLARTSDIEMVNWDKEID